MKQIIECGECSAGELSKKTILATGTGAFGRRYELAHKTAGYELAGSCLRYQAIECFGSLSYDRNGIGHGQWFKTLEEARSNFERFTTPIVEVQS